MKKWEIMEEDKILLTARYVEGDMDANESEAYRARLANDAELQAHLQHYKEIEASLKMQLADKEELLDLLAPFNSKYFHQRAAKKPIWKWMTGVAAVLFLGLLVWAPWRSHNLADKYGIDAKMEIAERGTAVDDLKMKAANYFNQGDFKNAERLLGKIYHDEPGNAQNAYFYAIALAKTNAYAPAEKIFIQLYHGKSVYQFDAAYQLGLIYLDTKNYPEAKKWFNKIPGGSLRYHNAQEILKKIN